MNHILTIPALLACYTMILSVFFVICKKRPGITSYQNPRAADLNLLSAAHAISIFFMLLPTWFISAPFFLLGIPDKLNNEQIIALLICIAIIGCMPWKKWNDSTQYTKSHPLPPFQIIFYAAFRFIFLIAYEWFFRGLLLISLLQIVDTITAIIINILLYMLVHFHKNRAEIVGCIPFGLLLCLFTIWYQSIWPAVIIHLLIAIRGEWPPIYRFFPLPKKAIL